MARGGGGVAAVLSAALKLAPAQQLEVMQRLSNVLVGQQQLPAALGEAIAQHAGQLAAAAAR